MNLRVKGNVRIGGALIMGMVVILGALYVKNTQPVISDMATVIQAPTRNYIESTDSDGDGIKDWEESLHGELFESIESPTSTSYFTDDTPYTPPTTLTGKFSEAFFQDYLQGKIDGADISNPTALISKAVTAIDANTKSSHHSRHELHVIPSTEEILHMYGNELASNLIRNSVKSDPELLIFKEALSSNKKSDLEKLIPIRDVYVQIIHDALQMDVPDTAVSDHINFLNASEDILQDLNAMLIAFEDPLYALARVRDYDSHAKALYASFESLGKLLTANTTLYTNKDPGNFFYYFVTQ